MLGPQIGELLAQPQQFKKHIIKVTLGALIISMIFVVFIDQSISQFFGRPEIKNIWWLPAREITDIGLSENYFLISILVWIFSKWIAPRIDALKKFPEKIDYFRRWGLNFLMSLIISGLLTHVIKALIGRQRPHKTPDFNAHVFEPFTAHWHWHSFSSGHSQVMFTAATFFTLALPRFKWLWFFIAVLLCSTRVVVLDHFVSDTIFGACIGYVGSLVALKWMKDNTSNGLY